MVIILMRNLTGGGPVLLRDRDHPVVPSGYERHSKSSRLMRRNADLQDVAIDPHIQYSVSQFIDVLPDLHLFAVYVFYFGITFLYGFLTYLSPSILAESATSLKIASLDSTLPIPVFLTLSNLTKDNKFVALSLRAIRRDLFDNTPLTLQITHTIQAVIGGSRSEFGSNDLATSTVRFNQESKLDESLDLLLCSYPLPTQFDRLLYNLSILIDRTDISFLVFTFSFIDTSARNYIHLMNYPLAISFLVILTCYLVNSQRGGDPSSSFFAVVLSALGFLSYSPLPQLMTNSIISEISEIFLREIYVNLYRTICLIQATMMDLKTKEVPPYRFCSLLIICGLLGIVTAISKYSQNQTRTEYLLYRTDLKIEPLDLARISCLLAYAAVCFAVLLHMLARMDMRYWNRASLVVVLVLSPMALESVCEIQWTVYRWTKSNVLEIVKNACYGVGGVLLVFAWTPVRRVPNLQGMEVLEKTRE
jgi:hypothetical protein